MDHCKECHAVKELVDYRDKLQSEVEKLRCCGNCSNYDIDWEEGFCYCALTSFGRVSNEKCDKWKWRGGRIDGCYKN